MTSVFGLPGFMFQSLPLPGGPVLNQVKPLYPFKTPLSRKQLFLQKEVNCMWYRAWQAEEVGSVECIKAGTYYTTSNFKKGGGESRFISFVISFVRKWEDWVSPHSVEDCFAVTWTHYFPRSVSDSVDYRSVGTDVLSVKWFLNFPSLSPFLWQNTGAA